MLGEPDWHVFFIQTLLYSALMELLSHCNGSWYSLENGYKSSCTESVPVNFIRTDSRCKGTDWLVLCVCGWCNCMFAAERLGLPYAVNYLDKSATVQNYLQGVNFASSGSGYLNITGYILVCTLYYCCNHDHLILLLPTNCWWRSSHATSQTVWNIFFLLWSCMHWQVILVTVKYQALMQCHKTALSFVLMSLYAPASYLDQNCWSWSHCNLRNWIFFLHFS